MFSFVLLPCFHSLPSAMLFLAIIPYFSFVWDNLSYTLSLNAHLHFRSQIKHHIFRNAFFRIILHVILLFLSENHVKGIYVKRPNNVPFVVLSLLSSTIVVVTLHLLSWLFDQYLYHLDCNLDENNQDCLFFFTTQLKSVTWQILIK
jgi:hypothetical protein